MERYTQSVDPHEFAERSETEPVYSHEEMEAFEPSMESMLLKLKDKIDNRHYSALVSDEVGGRIPTLVVSAIMKKVYGGEKPLKTLFLPGGYKLPDFSIKFPFYKKIVAELQNRLDPGEAVLIVTQFIRSGKSVGVMLYLLEQAMVRADVAAAYTTLNEDILAFSPDLKYTDRGRPEVFTGQILDNDDPEVDGKSVRKGLGIKKGNSGYLEIDPDSTEADKSALRNDIDIMAERLYERIWGDNHASR